MGSKSTTAVYKMSKSARTVPCRQNSPKLRLAKIKISEKYDHPRHFLLKNENHSDPEEYIDTDSDYEDEIRFYVKNSVMVGDKTAGLFDGSPDLDFMMPSRVREVLRSEGVSSHVIDRVIQRGEKRHRMALHLTVQQQKKSERIQDTKKIASNPKIPTLPKLTVSDQPPCLTSSDHSICCNDCRDVQARQSRRQGRSRPWQERSPCRDMSDGGKTDRTMTPPDSNTAVEEVRFSLTEAEMEKWTAEQLLEKGLVGSHFDPPRLVLVSSKIPKCHLLPKVLLNKEAVEYIIYDFDHWSFKDIMREIHKKLNSIKNGCKAKSVLLLCQGGPGHLYILRKFVITPQKLRKESYQPVIDFWKSLADLVSKINPEESKIHIAGCNFSDSPQGTEVIHMLQRLIHPNMVYIESPRDHTREGKLTLSLYFRAKIYERWRLKSDESDDELGDEDHNRDDRDNENETRTWSALARKYENSSNK